LKTLIVGAGAIGCLVGGKLAQSGFTVTLVGRERFVTAVEAHGLQVVDERGTHQIADVSAVDSIAAAYAIQDGTPLEKGYDVAIFTVKSYDTADALAELADVLELSGAKPPLAFSLQNGVGNEEALADRLGSENVAAGTITTPVSVLAPGQIRVDKPKYVVGISPWQPENHSATFLELKQALINSGFAVTEFPDAQGMKWTKLLMNMVGNATSAILDEPPEEVFQDSALVDLEIDAWREALAVMSALGIEPVNLENYPFAKLAPWIRRTPKSILRPILRKQIGGARGGKMPSLHIDLYRDKGKSEVGWLNGAVVRHGRDAVVPTPINQALTEALTCLVHDPSKRKLWKQNNLRLIVSAEDHRER
jgi:2-dehydropantoate 2-reductase